MSKTLSLGLAALAVVFMISCGNSNVLGVGDSGKRETKLQFFNGLYHLDGAPFVAEFWVDDTNEQFGQRTQASGPIKIRVESGRWSELTKISHCEKEALREIILYDGPWAQYVFRNVPIKCERDNKYEIFVFGGWPTYRWILAD